MQGSRWPQEHDEHADSGASEQEDAPSPRSDFEDSVHEGLLQRSRRGGDLRSDGVPIEAGGARGSVQNGPTAPDHHHRRHGSAVGTVCIVFLVVVWVLQSELAQHIQTQPSWNRPYLITWINHSVLALLWPLGDALIKCRRVYCRAVGLPCDSWASRGLLQAALEASQQPFRHHLVSSAWLSLVFLGADYMWYIALPHSSVSLGSCLFNTTCVFTYLLSVAVLSNRPSAVGALGVVLTITGAVVTSNASGTSNGTMGSLIMPTPESADDADAVQAGHNDWRANALIVGAAAMLSAYQVLYKVRQPSASLAVILFLASLIGLVSFVFLWFGLFIANATPDGNNFASWFHEPLLVPSSEHAQSLTLNAFVGLCFNMLFMSALAFTTPVLVAVGIALTIPASGVTDWLVHGDSFPPTYVLGCVCVVGGFMLLAWLETQSEEDDDNDLPQHRHRRRAAHVAD